MGAYLFVYDSEWLKMAKGGSLKIGIKKEGKGKDPNALISL
jgi:hypothetical protein